MISIRFTLNKGLEKKQNKNRCMVSRIVIQFGRLLQYRHETLKHKSELFTKFHINQRKKKSM